MCIKVEFFKVKPAVRNVDNKIPELGECGTATSFESGPPARKRTSPSYEAKDMHFKNAPYIVWVYTDHERKIEIICVAIQIISGASDVDYVLSDDNITLNVTYVWPSSLFSPDVLFKKKLEGGWTMQNPKIYTFKARLMELGLSESSRQEVSVEIKLPMKVLRESHACVQGGIKTKEGNVLMLEFQAFQKEHVLKDLKPKIVYE